MRIHPSTPLFIVPALVCIVAAGAVSCSSSTRSDGGLGSAVGSIVFVKRQHTTDTDGTVSIDVAGGNGQVIDYQRYVPGGGVYVLTPPRADGELRNLTAAFPTADIAGLDLSFDAKDVVYAMKRTPDDHYHIYTTQLASGETHQRTFGDNDDINPIFVPGDRIAFVTNEPFTEMGTRADEYNHGRAVTQLAVISASGGEADRRLCSQNLSHTVNPFLRSDGTIGYSRWEHFGGVNDVKLFRVSPDCTQMIHVAGQSGKPSNSLVQVSEVAPNVMVGIATDRERTIQAGAVVKIDAQWYANGAVEPNRLDSEHVKYEVLTPAVPVGDDASPAGRYRNPRGLDGGRLLVSWANGNVNDLNELSQTPPDFGIYVLDPTSSEPTNQLVYNDKSTWDLYAIPVTPRATPPIIGSVQNSADSTVSATLGSLDIKNTDLASDTVTTSQHYSGAESSQQSLSDALRGATRVRIVEGFSSEAAPGITMFGLTMDEGAAVLGEATVYGDGSWLAEVPPYIPVHLQPVDKFGMSLRNQRLWIQAMPGESRVCGGCHESRTGDNTLGITQTLTAAASKGPEKLNVPITAREEYPWERVQTLLDAKCVACHNDTTNGSKPQSFYRLVKTNPDGTTLEYPIPTLSFSSAPITVYYDRALRAWPTSYVSIFYPAVAAMTMKGYQIAGTVPPTWGVPESARESVLIEKLNVRASDGSHAWDTATHPTHPEDVGVSFTDEERATLVRVMDLGGQFYARKGSGFVANTNDPTAQTPGGYRP